MIFVTVDVLLATAMIASIYNIQTAKALSTGDNNFGRLQASQQAIYGMCSPIGPAPCNPANGNGLGATTSGLTCPVFGGIISCFARMLVSTKHTMP